MAFKINGVIISETSKVNGVLWATGKKLNGKQLNICYTYTLQNNNPLFPPQPDITFNYNDCGGSAQSVDIPSGGNQQVCALVDSVSFGGDGSATKGSRCTS